MEKYLLHITTKEDWEAAQSQVVYRPESLTVEGFIHCSKVDQIVGTANRFFLGQAGLVLLVIDPQRVAVPIKFEDLLGEGKLFPHIYGPLELESVVDVIAFPPKADGSFELPSGLMEYAS